MAHALLEEGNNQNSKWTVYKIYRKFKKRNFVTYPMNILEQVSSPLTWA